MPAGGFDTSRRTTFNQVAELYDEVRPGYPEQLIQDILDFSQIFPGGRILEIGPGPGNATLPFARRGFEMLGLELGAELATLAARNFYPYPKVKIQNVAFEDWRLQARFFDLVISAQAFHWIAPEVRFVKSAAALKATGAIAIFWNYHPRPDDEIFKALDRVYRHTAPQIGDPSKTMPPRERMVKITLDDIQASGCFGPAQLKRYPWSESYTTAQYIKLLNTYSDHRGLDEDTRQRLFGQVRELIERFGGVLNKPYLAMLYLARLRR